MFPFSRRAHVVRVARSDTGVPAAAVVETELTCVLVRTGVLRWWTAHLRGYALLRFDADRWTVQGIEGPATGDRYLLRPGRDESAEAVRDAAIIELATVRPRASGIGGSRATEDVAEGAAERQLRDLAVAEPRWDPAVIDASVRQILRMPPYMGAVELKDARVVRISSEADQVEVAVRYWSTHADPFTPGRLRQDLLAQDWTLALSDVPNEAWKLTSARVVP
jgi:hypothetical protein